MAEWATGGLQGADPGEGGATGLRVRQADEVEFEICTGRPKRLTGVEKGHVVFATFERADGKDGGDFGFLVLDFRFLRSQPEGFVID